MERHSGETKVHGRTLFRKPGCLGPSITLVSSIVASRGSPGLAVYAATKAA